jgi:hypothetical protein
VVIHGEQRENAVGHRDSERTHQAPIEPPLEQGKGHYRRHGEDYPFIRLEHDPDRSAVILPTTAHRGRSVVGASGEGALRGGDYECTDLTGDWAVSESFTDRPGGLFSGVFEIWLVPGFDLVAERGPLTVGNCRK